MELLHLGADEGESSQLGPYHIQSLVPREAEAAMTAYRVRIAPHSKTAVSYHLVAEELYYVLAGAGIAVLDGREYSLRTGDFLRLPPGTTHGFVTAEEELLMLDIHSPGSRPDRDVYFQGEVPTGFSPPALPSSHSQG